MTSPRPGIAKPRRKPEKRKTEVQNRLEQLLARIGTATLLAVLLGACSSVGKTLDAVNFLQSPDNVEPPAELVEFEEVIDVERLWSRDLGHGTDEQLVHLVIGVAGDKLVIGGRDGKITALNQADGERIWEVELGVPLSAGPGLGGDMAVFGTSEGDVIALNVETGVVQWRAEVTSEVLAVPVVVNRHVVARCVDGRVFGFDSGTGRRDWTYDRSVPLLSLRGNSDPVVFGNRVIFGFDNGGVGALSASNGTVLWEQSVATGRGRTEIDRLADIDGAIGVYGQDMYVSSYNGRVGSLAMESGRVLWVRDIGSYAGVAVDGDGLYLTDAESKVFRLDRRNGASMWEQPLLVRRNLTVPVPAGDAVVTGDLEGYIHWLDKDDGNMLARERLEGDPIQATPVWLNETLFVLGSGGAIAAYATRSRAEE